QEIKWPYPEPAIQRENDPQPPRPGAYVLCRTNATTAFAVPSFVLRIRLRRAHRRPGRDGVDVTHSECCAAGTHATHRASPLAPAPSEIALGRPNPARPHSLIPFARPVGEGVPAAAGGGEGSPTVPRRSHSALSTQHSALRGGSP